MKGRKKSMSKKNTVKSKVDELLEEANDLSIDDLRDLADSLNALADCLEVEAVAQK